MRKPVCLQRVLGYVYGVSDKSMASEQRAIVNFVGYFDAVDYDYLSQRREVSARVYLRKVCISPCCYNANLSRNECDESIRH